MATAGCADGDGESSEALHEACTEWHGDRALSYPENDEASRHCRGNVGDFVEHDDAPTSGSWSGGRHSKVRTESVDGGSPILQFLRSRGASDSLIRQLARKADATGYGISTSTPMSYQQAQDFAVAIIRECDQMAAGETSWSAEVYRDVATGATPAAAQEMHTYLRASFCPEVS